MYLATRSIWACFMLFMLAGGGDVAIAEGRRWKPWPSLPDKEGFAGTFAGIVNDSLLVAGGANFPDKKPWEGGKKQWYDDVWQLDGPNGAWVHAGKLPIPLGYGVSATHRNAMIVAGGSNADGHHIRVYRVQFRENRLAFEPLPDLPAPLANMCGAIIEDHLYVAGGITMPDATKTESRFLRLDLNKTDSKWEVLESWKSSPRMLATAAVYEGSLWLLGGTDLFADETGKPKRRYLLDAHRFHPKTGWSQLPDLPWPIVAGPSPAPVVDSRPLVLGGDDGTQLDVPFDRHRGFTRVPITFDPAADRWVPQPETPFATVTAPVVGWKQWWVVVSGEIAPGVRTPRVWEIESIKGK